MSTRARYGTGSIIFEENKKLWKGRIRIKGKVKTVYAKTQREAESKLKAERDAAYVGHLLPPARYTVGKLMSDYLEAKKPPATAPKTWRGYEEKARNHIIPTWGRTALAALTPGQIEKELNAKVASGLSAMSARHIRAILRSALSWGINNGLTHRNVAQQAVGPKVARKKVEPFTPEEVEQITSGLRGDRLEALYLVEIALGLRPGELLGLTWPKVDLNKGTVQIHNTLQHIDGEYRLVPRAKTDESYATMFLPAFAAEALRQHRTRQREENLAATTWRNDWDLVFTTKDGYPIHETILWKHFQELLTRLGLPRRSFYSLRHTSASLLIHGGAEMRDVMEHLRHSQISLTANTYTHLYESRKRATAQRMDDLLKRNC
ncbi:MAG TPA: site-specific integrase [Chloroflexota bacterium]|nr:site-specific integrase [Chloroflexota bacterium]